MWQGLKDTAAHYWHGSKLLAADIRIAGKLLGRVASARALTRREHNLLVRVCADIARIVPLAFFVLVPMMEFALPFAIRLFPNLLPSTFTEKRHIEEQRKKLLKVRMEMGKLLQHTLDERAAQVTREERARERKKSETQAPEIAPQVPDGINSDVREFMVRMKEGGRAASSSELIGIMKGFKDNVTLDHLYRDQLVAMAQFLGMNHFAPTALLRYQLRQRLRKLRNEDRDIHWEGVHSISEAELRQDLRHRGLPTSHMSPEEMRAALKDWLRLSQVREIPYSLLIMTNMLHFAGTRLEQKERARLTSADDDASIDLAAAQAALSSLPVEMAAKSTLVEEVSNDEKLETLEREERLIEEERLVQDTPAKPADISATVEDDDVDEDTAPQPESTKDSDSETISDEAEGQTRLTREQVADLAEAMDTMIDSPLSAEKLEMEELKAEREKSRMSIEEAKRGSQTVAMLDSRVNSMLERIRQEMADSEETIGDSFHKLDLDGDGILTYAELVAALEEIKLEKRPDAKAFQELLLKMDKDGDGQIAVSDFRRVMKEMQMKAVPLKGEA